MKQKSALFELWGEGKWQRITWDEAYDTIEQRLKEIRDKYGAESVIFSHIMPFS